MRSPKRECFAKIMPCPGCVQVLGEMGHGRFKIIKGLNLNPSSINAHLTHSKRERGEAVGFPVFSKRMVL